MNNTNGKNYSSGYDSTQAQSSDNSCTDARRDLPLLVGYAEGPALMADLGFEGDAKPLVLDAMGSVACSAVVGARAGLGVSFSLHDGFYTGLQRRYHRTLTRGIIRQAVVNLESMGLIDVTWSASWAQGGKGRQSTLRATPRLIERAGDRAFQRPRLKEIIRLYDANGRLMTYDETSETRAMRTSLADWNADLHGRKVVVTDPGVTYLEDGSALVPTKDGEAEYIVRLDQVETYRRFKGDFTHVGRCFGAGYQSLTKAARATIEIEGSATASADLGCSHIRMAYSQVGADPGEHDAYVIAGYGEEKRRFIKRAVNIAINCDKGRNQALETIAFDIVKADRMSELGTEEGAQVGPYDRRAANAALEAIERHHAPIQQVFYTGAGSRFMKVETDIITGTAATARRYNITVLGIHDEVIAPADKIDLISDILAAEWSRRISAHPIVNKGGSGNLAT